MATLYSDKTKSTSNTPHAGTKQTSASTVPCFVEGSMILTPSGYRQIESLRAGDKILTRNSGAQVLRWVGSRKIDCDTGAITGYRPILIPASALAPGVPESDLYLSANHRILIKHTQCKLLFGQSEVLVPAESLIGENGIDRLGASFGFHYFHLLFDQHEVVIANGLPCESFHPAHVGLDAFKEKTREQVLAIFPELRLGETIYGPTARLALKPSDADILRNAAFGPQTSNQPYYPI